MGLSRHEIAQNVQNVFKNLFQLQECCNISISYKTKIDLINLLLHTESIYKSNEQLAYRLIDSEPEIVKVTYIENVDLNQQRNLNIWETGYEVIYVPDIDNVIFGISSADYDDIKLILKSTF